MVEIKPRIFIGSSTEGKRIAEFIEQELSPIAECRIWPNEFNIGRSAYEDLVNKLSLFDYGILVATADDVLKSRGERRKAIRDNILFEFGLFAGRLGRDACFLIQEEGAKIPSDLAGITLTRFPSSNQNLMQKLLRYKQGMEQQEVRIRELCNKIKEHIARRDRMFPFGFLPSTALAYGYFNNFILKATSQLLDLKELKIGHTCPFPRQCQKEEHENGQAGPSLLNGTPFRDVKFTILIPERLSADMFDKAKATRKENNWQQIKIDAGDVRPFDFYVSGSVASSGILELSDIPITLNSLREAIKAYVNKSYVGISAAEELLECREIRVFKQVLDYLITTNPITKDRVKTLLINS